MGIEYINRITVKKDGVYISTKSNNDGYPYHSVRLEEMSRIYAEEGKDAYEKELLRMIQSYCELRGSHKSLEKYRYALYSLKAEQIEEKFYNKKQVVMQRFEKEYGDYRDWSEEVKKEYRSIANKINDEELTERVNLVTEYENKIRLKMWSFLNKYQIAAMSFEGKRKAAENSQTPSEFLYSLASAEYSDEENQHEIFLALAQNKNISEETMKILAKSEDTTVQWLMVNNCNVTEDIIRELVRDYAEDDDMLIEAIANCEITPLDILANLSKSEDECVREGVAENLKTPPETLLEMALNKDERFGLIYNEIAMNPNSTVEILSILLDKKHEYSEKGISNWTETIFASVKQNRNATDEIKSRVDEYMEQITANELKEVAKAHKKEQHYEQR